MKGRVLAIAGSDSGGGAGIQADIKTITALGGYAMTAITALTAQNTIGITAMQDVPAEFVAAQIKAVLDDIGADAIKIGMLATAEIGEIVCEILLGLDLPIVLDPVMISTSGSTLLADNAISILKQSLFPISAIITPNIPEAEALTGVKIETLDDMRHAAEVILRLRPEAVLIKGGHGEGGIVTDLLVTGDGERVFTTPRIETRNIHGTGCTLASAIATGLAQGMDLSDAVGQAHDYVHRAILTAPGYGKGNGPLNHGADFIL